VNTDELLRRIADVRASIDERSAAGDALAEAGDPRLEDSVDLLVIPAGILHHKRSRDSQVEPIEMHAFAIARHPVTVHAFAEFIDAGGYDDGSLWSSAGWRWRVDADIDMPRFWDEPEWAPYLVPNHPVVGVSVFEAEAYAAFREARLPSAREWERACRGDDARDYPWGDEWHDDACGHRDYGPRCTLAIGIFPRGVSAFGLHDMVGNVWQWTSDEGDAEGPAARVACGGAWNNLPWSIGAAGRNAFAQDARFSNLGFRLARDV
jgi:formylglycine-generating enzyme required for sulfatase activity